MKGNGAPDIDSLWRAIAPPRRDEVRQLDGDIRTDVAVVGAGYTGLAAAYALQKRGIDVAVLDAHTVGWGASGRNGGAVLPKFRLSYRAMASQHGLATAKAMHRIAHEGVDTVEALISEFNISEASFVRSGSLRCAHNQTAMRALVAEAEWTRDTLDDDTLEVFDRDQVTAEIGSSVFYGGVLSKDAGTVLPLNYARGLAAGLKERGVPIFENTPVSRIERTKNEATLHAPGGVVRARRVIVATDAYGHLTEATSHYAKLMIPFRTAAIATEKLPPILFDSLLKGHRSYNETRRMMKWFRKADGRVLFGGRGVLGKESAHEFAALRRALVSTFPQLVSARIEFEWSGNVGMTVNQLPHIGRDGDAAVYCLGYNGAGVSLSSVMGQAAAALAIGELPELSLTQADRLQTIPLHALATPAAKLAASWYTFLDAIGR
ncbi:FAD dependent oxidoreductase [Caballeronia hypogeia]|uniref:FAD dependent oxidoreductase n=1 Tax=Caballeronia hypogeia TaxID=1777140 RepID=A0A158CJB6_9BURK|nr:FAD-binding oxidoreductase [Caballeronia hypogeia]SAK82429.1 FAD dependent oxidoreductase [Caballeronia hypogeia]